MTVKFARQFGSMLALVLLLAAGTADAQFNASLSGTVLDSTQAAIPGAKVTLTNTGTQATQVVTSGSAGSFAFNALPPGSYTLQVEANGFQGNTINNVSVTAETPRNLNVTLQAGKESQTVTVDADTLPVRT
jgi:septal ring-binding cell division protein DamX